ncbi:MAG: type II toxin-antitoxin system Phd/YefM family antitoxin [Deltaproteobacteria bacterium]|nr:MAG: type II toxin-antitoxin system Phd/YefM family antitoxin [Deltaproteobacteria bacterium]
MDGGRVRLPLQRSDARAGSGHPGHREVRPNREGRRESSRDHVHARRGAAGKPRGRAHERRAPLLHALRRVREGRPSRALRRDEGAGAAGVFRRGTLNRPISRRRPATPPGDALSPKESARGHLPRPRVSDTLSAMKTVTLRALRRDARVLDVAASGQEILVTRFGKPYVRIVPAKQPRSFLGAGKHLGIRKPVSPEAIPSSEWKGLR